MIKILLLIICTFCLQTLSAQKEVEMSIEYGVENPDLQAILMFENIGFETFNFFGEINGKYYQINVKEFKNGELINSIILFNGSESEYFKIKNDSLLFNFLSKNSKEGITIQLQGNGFSSKKLTFETSDKYGIYVLKDFLGSKRTTKIPVNKPFPILCIITPTVYKDGSASYCNVAQANVAPEKLGDEFNIPHYFVVEMQFK